MIYSSRHQIFFSGSLQMRRGGLDFKGGSLHPKFVCPLILETTNGAVKNQGGILIKAHPNFKCDGTTTVDALS